MDKQLATNLVYLITILPTERWWHEHLKAELIKYVMKKYGINDLDLFINVMEGHGNEKDKA